MANRDKQTGPAIGQRYWFAHKGFPDFDTYFADYFDLNVCVFQDIYPESRFAEDELRARKLIQAVNKRRKELNEGKEFGDRQYYIVFWNSSGLGVWESACPLCAGGDAYPFGLFKESADCEMCMREFEDELEWFYGEHLPLMAELDDYDWANAPGWREED